NGVEVGGHVRDRLADARHFALVHLPQEQEGQVEVVLLDPLHLVGGQGQPALQRDDAVPDRRAEVQGDERADACHGYFPSSLSSISGTPSKSLIQIQRPWTSRYVPEVPLPLSLKTRASKTGTSLGIRASTPSYRPGFGPSRLRMSTRITFVNAPSRT